MESIERAFAEGAGIVEASIPVQGGDSCHVVLRELKFNCREIFCHAGWIDTLSDHASPALNAPAQPEQTYSQADE